MDNFPTSQTPPPGFLISLASAEPETPPSPSAAAARIRELAAGRAIAPLKRSRCTYPGFDTFEGAGVYTARGDNWLCTLAVPWASIPRLEAALGVVPNASLVRTVA